MPKQNKKQQLQIKKDFENKGVQFNDKQIKKNFRQTFKNINDQLDSFYTQFKLSPETIDTLRSNPEFAIGISDLKDKTDAQINALFQNFQEATYKSIDTSYNTGLAMRVWQAEAATQVVFNIEKQPLPFVKELLENKDIVGFSLGDRIKSLTDETLIKVKDYLESSLMVGNSIGDTSRGIRDIIGYSPDGKRLKGGLAKATRISRTETRRAYQTGADIANKELNDYGIKSDEIWQATLDRRTRVYHLAADGQKRGQVVKDKFIVGGEEMDHPLDPSASARNVINCRCYVEYTTEPNRATQRAVRDHEGNKAAGIKRPLPKNLKDASWKHWKKNRLSEMGIKTSF